MLAEDAPGAGTGLAQPPRSAELSEVLIAAPRCPEGLPDPLPASSNPAPGRQRAARRRYRGVRECVCVYMCVPWGLRLHARGSCPALALAASRLSFSYYIPSFSSPPILTT